MIVFGFNPRVPAVLLSDQLVDEPGWQAVTGTCVDRESPSGAYAEAMEVRRKARELLMHRDASDKLRRVASARKHTDLTFSPGQWVYVYRRKAVSSGNRRHRPRQVVRPRRGHTSKRQHDMGWHAEKNMEVRQ